MMKKTGYIYFITDGIGHIKIGVTDAPERRIKQLQTGNANFLEIIFQIETDSMEEAYEVEALLHEMFSDNRINGEWFEEKPVIKLLKRRTIKIGDYKVNGMNIRNRFLVSFFDMFKVFKG